MKEIIKNISKVINELITDGFGAFLIAFILVILIGLIIVGAFKYYFGA